RRYLVASAFLRRMKNPSASRPIPKGRRSGFRSGRERDEFLWRRILAGVAAAGDRVIGVRGVDGERRELIGGEGLPGAPREPVEDAIGIEIGVIGGGKRALQVSLNGRAAEDGPDRVLNLVRLACVRGIQERQGEGGNLAVALR